MDLTGALEALQNAPFAVAIVESLSLFPWIEATHVFAIVTVVGTISIVDLRLIGITKHPTNVKRLMQQLLPVTWAAFAVAAVSGFLLFSSRAVDYAANGPFRAKLVLLAFAGINMIVFHFVTNRSDYAWAEGTVPRRARIAGMASLVLWIAIIFAGRWIGFALQEQLTIPPL